MNYKQEYKDPFSDCYIVPSGKLFCGGREVIGSCSKWVPGLSIDNLLIKYPINQFITRWKI